MALFNRKKTQTISELEDYYATKQTRTGMAWLMAFLSLLVTVVVIAALFFGGRLLYRTLTDNDSGTTVTTGEIRSSDTDGSTIPAEADSSTNSTDETVNGDDFPSVVTDEAASTDVPNTDRIVATTPTTGDTTELPNTGAGEILVVAPIVAVIAGYFINRKQQLNS